MEADFVLCARSQRHEIALCGALGLREPVSTSVSLIDSQHADLPEYARSCVIRKFANSDLWVTALPLGRPYQLHALERLLAQFPRSHFLVVDMTLTDRHLHAAFTGQQLDRISMVRSVQQLEMFTGIEIAHDRRRYLAHDTRLHNDERIDVQMLVGFSPGGRGEPVFLPIISTAQLLSLQAQEAERNHRPPPPPELSEAAQAKLAEGWEGVLREPVETDDEEAQCIACYTHWASIVFVPCGHQVLCDACARTLCEKAKRACPVCREAIPQIVRLHEQRPRPTNATDAADVERDQVSPRASDTDKHQASDSGGSLSPPRKKRRR